MLTPEAQKQAQEVLKLIKADKNLDNTTVLQDLLDAAATEALLARGTVPLPPPIPPPPPPSLLDWSQKYRKINDSPFEVPPFLIDIYNDTHPLVAVKKAAQVMVSEWLVNLALYTADVKLGGRGNTLYLYPTQNKLNEFSHARIDSAIEQSPYLQQRTNAGVNNVSLKQVGTGFAYFRGAERRRSVITVDADLIIADEFDEMAPWVRSVAEKRLGSSLLGWMRFASTPTYTGVGIDAMYEDSDQRWYFVPCNHCNHKQPLVFDNLDFESFEYFCEHCHMPMDRCAPGAWVPLNPSPASNMHGYYISKLYSPRANLQLMIDASYATSETERQEFFNSDLGLAYSPRGANLSPADLNSCIDDNFDEDEPLPPGKTFMGVDVGSVLHVTIVRYFTNTEGYAPHPYVIRALTVDDWADLDVLMNQYDIDRCAVDAGPEIRAPKEFVNRFPGRACRVTYKTEGAPDYDETEDFHLTIPRTETMDEMYARFLTRSVRLPTGAMAMGGKMRMSDRVGPYYSMMMAPNRILKQNARGNTVAVYDEAGKPDHFAHSTNYVFIASHSEWFNRRWASPSFLSLGTGFEETKERVQKKLRGEMVAP